MTVVLLGSRNRYSCLSSDTKPTDAPAGSVCTESDTGNSFVWNGTAWLAVPKGWTW